MSARESKGKREDERGLSIGVVVAVIVAVILIAMIIFIVIWLTSATKPAKAECLLDTDCAGGKICRNEKCVAAPSCTSPPATPTNVNVVYNQNLGEATVSWDTVTGATSYKVYRKLGDPSVNSANFDEKRVVVGNAVNFSNLAVGTHYFVVASSNECGDSQASSPYLIAPSCSSVPNAPAMPIITQDADHCADPQNAEYTLLSHEEATGDRPFNLVQGNGQFGVSSYFAVFESPTGDFNVNLACTGQSVAYAATSISVGEYANLTFPDQPMVLGSSIEAKWDPVLAAEEYAVTLVFADANGTYMFTGGTVAAPITTLTVPTLTGAYLVYASVVAYQLCNKSLPSQVAVYMSATV
jgi:hypothetical protein